MNEEFPVDIQQPMPGVQSSAPDMVDVTIPTPLNDTLEPIKPAEDDARPSTEDLEELEILKDNLEDYFRDSNDDYDFPLTKDTEY